MERLPSSRWPRNARFAIVRALSRSYPVNGADHRSGDWSSGNIDHQARPPSWRAFSYALCASSLELERPDSSILIGCFGRARIAGLTNHDAKAARGIGAILYIGYGYNISIDKKCQTVTDSAYCEQISLV